MAEKTPLQIFYDKETNQLENDVAYLDTQLDKYDDHIGALTPLGPIHLMKHMHRL